MQKGGQLSKDRGRPASGSCPSRSIGQLLHGTMPSKIKHCSLVLSQALPPPQRSARCTVLQAGHRTLTCTRKRTTYSAANRIPPAHLHQAAHDAQRVVQAALRFGQGQLVGAAQQHL